MAAGSHPSLEYLMVAGVAAGGSYIFTPIARAIAIRIEAVAKPRDRDVHAVATPRMGGVALFVGFTLAVFVAAQLPTLRSSFHNGPVLPWIVVAAGLICLIGVIDDKYELDSLTKLAGQVLATGIMVTVGGVQLEFIYLPWGNDGTLTLSSNIAIPLTILLTVLTINAVNFIDGLDGLAAGVVAIGAVAFFLYSYRLAQHDFANVAGPPTLICAAVAGTCLGFLPYNFFPARIFMGDSGSMLVGLMLSAAATTATTNVDTQGITGPADSLPLLLPLLLSLAVLAIPFIDLLLAVVRRLGKGRSPFAPDKQHLHHRLLELGHSHRRAVLLMYFWAALLSFGCTAFSIFNDSGVVVIVLLCGLVIGILLLVVPRLRRPRRQPPAPVSVGASDPS
jgi:UDP-GlcNAc:undecaprenyl-phosphate GlcNAc-1-phosphate transferase